MDLSKLRQDYQQPVLSKKDLLNNPLEQCKEWLKVADKHGEPLANAFVLSTTNLSGKVSTRSVLLQSIEHDKLYFYTNYNSQKASDIAENDQVSLAFAWYVLRRQISLIGTVKKTSREHSENYFATRPRQSQLAAWASKQSQTIKNREELEKQYEYYEQKFLSKTIPCPDFWGGYEFSATSIEFWQGNKWRLHDRFLYQKQAEKWKIMRLAP